MRIIFSALNDAFPSPGVEEAEANGQQRGASWSYCAVCLVFYIYIYIFFFFFTEV